MFVRGSAGIGRQARLRILCRIRRVGSSPISCMDYRWLKSLFYRGFPILFIYYFFLYNTYTAHCKKQTALRRISLSFYMGVIQFELSPFFKAFQASYSEVLCIFPYFCPYEQSTRENFNDEQSKMRNRLFSS